MKAVRVPVIAAGGIADAAGVRAALGLGAAAVQIGTAYLLCPEATTSAIHRAALQSAAAGHTALTNVFTGRPARSIVNRLVREVGPISAAAPAFPLAVTRSPRYEPRPKRRASATSRRSGRAKTRADARKCRRLSSHGNWPAPLDSRAQVNAVANHFWNGSPSSGTGFCWPESAARNPSTQSTKKPR